MPRFKRSSRIFASPIRKKNKNIIKESVKYGTRGIIAIGIVVNNLRHGDDTGLLATCKDTLHLKGLFVRQYAFFKLPTKTQLNTTWQALSSGTN